MIKFRAKRVDCNEVIEGYYVQTPNGGHRIYWQPFSEATNNTYHYIDKTTLSMSTGLLDKHGKEIFGSFEVNGVMSNGGDVLQYGHFDKRQYPVYFENGMFRTKINAICLGNDTSEIIGNQTEL